MRKPRIKNFENYKTLDEYVKFINRKAHTNVRLANKLWADMMKRITPKGEYIHTPGGDFRNV